MGKYRTDLDALKGLCIIAVILFHIGLLRSGFLGVDAFFVINGYLIIPSIFKHVENGDFSYGEFLKKRIVRLLPLVLIVCVLSLALGAIFMLPFEYERLARSVMSSVLLSENLRSAITFGNYWEILNDYSPLFHLWYVGILFEFYIIFPMFILVCRFVANKINQREKNVYLFASIALAILSLMAYVFFPAQSQYKFYLLPFRLFEILAGGIVAVYAESVSKIAKPYVQKICLLLVSLIIFMSLFSIMQDGVGHQVWPIAAYGIGITMQGLPFSPELLLIFTVLLTCVVVFKELDCRITKNNILVYLGKRSYSFYIWHQFVIAFYRNSVSDEVSFVSVVICLALTTFFSETSYRFVERKICVNTKTLVVCALGILLLSPMGLYVYKNGGVIKDVPELDLKKGDGFVGVAVNYVDIPTADDKPFPEDDNGKMNVLVVGNSFSRDFCNILKESKYADKINFSYRGSDYPVDRISKADYIFTFLKKESLTDSIMALVKPTCKIYGIGTKNFGKSNNQFYSHRWSDKYYTSTTLLPWEYRKANEISKEHWGGAYVDLIAPAMVDESHVRVFTPEHKYISQDCMHLTKAGAQWYASVLDLEKIFGEM